MFESLDVGCGNDRFLKGTVNVDLPCGGKNLQRKDELVEEVKPREVSNLIIADASHLPFKNEAFNLTFTSRTIERVKDPYRVFSELHRVANRKVIIRCLHNRGSGAKNPIHINYFNEYWFAAAASQLGYKSRQFISKYDYPFSSRLKCPVKWQKSLLWKALRYVERRWLIHRFRIPFELESWSNIIEDKRIMDPVSFIVVSNDKKTLSECFRKGLGVKPENATVYMNTDKTPLPTFFNQHINNIDLERDIWFVFCHQDFILKEDLSLVFSGLDANSVYGVIGTRASSANLFGRILQTDNTPIGLYLTEPEPVQTLDEMCVVVHSSLLRKGLRFDNRFRFHFYVADLCIQAYTQGFGVYALQIACQHKSKNLIGDRASEEFTFSKNLFAKKWRLYLPIRTTTGVVKE